MVAVPSAAFGRSKCFFAFFCRSKSFENWRAKIFAVRRSKFGFCRSKCCPFQVRRSKSCAPIWWPVLTNEKESPTTVYCSSENYAARDAVHDIIHWQLHCTFSSLVFHSDTEVLMSFKLTLCRTGVFVFNIFEKKKIKSLVLGCLSFIW